MEMSFALGILTASGGPWGGLPSLRSMTTRRGPDVAPPDLSLRQVLRDPEGEVAAPGTAVDERLGAGEVQCRHDRVGLLPGRSIGSLQELDVLLRLGKGGGRTRVHALL